MYFQLHRQNVPTEDLTPGLLLPNLMSSVCNAAYTLSVLTAATSEAGDLSPMHTCTHANLYGATRFPLILTQF